MLPIQETLRRCWLFWLCLLATTAAAESPAGMTWPQGRVLPRFSTPSDSLDAIAVQSLTRDEQITFSALQGQVNKTRPRVWLINNRSEEGRNTWLNTLGFKIGKTYNTDDKLSLIAKYASELRGVVLYEGFRNPHMRNLASTVAGLRGALPMTRNLQERLTKQGLKLPVVEDLTKLDLASAMDVYEHLYNVYWPECEKRFLISARPRGRGGDYHHTRDLAAACGAAVVWLDCRDPAERALFGKFLADMPVGNAVVLGWYTSERSGITTASQYGIGTMPADHFMNATVLSSGQLTAEPPRPPAPALENKFYIAVLLSDGDNVQYTQHALRRIWDRSKAARGRAPLNWTIAPGLVDIAPGILDYYYRTATPSDCFASGPSGMGYAIPVNTLTEPGAPLGPVLTDPKRMDAYARLTSRYLQRSGLRVLTIWDNASGMQRAAYERACPHLLGVTVQNFKDDPSVRSSVENNRLRFERLAIAYAGSRDHIRRSIERRLARWDGQSPSFTAYQANIWSELKPARLVEFMHEIEREHKNVQFVRADHYFQLLSQSASRLR